MTSNSDPKRELLRHTVATLAYRGGNAVRNAPAGFAEFRGCESGRTPAQILAHIGDLLDWGLSIAQGKQSWNRFRALALGQRNRPVLCRAQEIRRLPGFGGAAACAAGEAFSRRRIADALTHVGQIAMLRRMAGGPVKGEELFRG